MNTNEISFEKICEITSHFPEAGKAVSAVECHNGHINRTFFVDCVDEKGNTKKFVLQRLNTSIFKDPDGVMQNIDYVTDHIRKKLAECGQDVKRGAQRYLKGDADPSKSSIRDSEDGFWRMSEYIDAENYQSVDSAELFGRVGYAFGHFQSQLSDFDASLLRETIPNFHNTAARYLTFENSVSLNRSGRADSVKDEIEFLRARRDKCSLIVDAIANKELPLRVTHNDTKLNNIMVDAKTGEGICVIDLDTVMPGSVLYDFGDSIRFGASSAAEDETDLSKVFVKVDYFKAYAEGFIKGLNNSLTDKEIDMLPIGAYVITLETGMRFLTDYIDGDTYFHTSYPQHNLDRARNQFKLVADMESKMPEFNEIVKKLK